MLFVCYYVPLKPEEEILDILCRTFGYVISSQLKVNDFNLERCLRKQKTNKATDWAIKAQDWIVINKSVQAALTLILESGTELDEINSSPDGEATVTVDALVFRSVIANLEKAENVLQKTCR